MKYLGLIFFSIGLVLGLLVLFQALQSEGFSPGYVTGSVLVAGSLLMLGFAVWGISQDIRWYFHDRNRPPSQHEPGYVPTPEQKVIFALQKEMVHHYQQAKDELERFECGDGPEHAVESEKSFRIAISACQKIGGHEGEVDSYSSEMLLRLTELLELQQRDAEIRVIAQDVVDFYQRQSQRTDGVQYCLDWGLAYDACLKLASYERGEGNEAAANALEDQGRHWVNQYMGDLSAGDY